MTLNTVSTNTAGPQFVGAAPPLQEQKSALPATRQAAAALPAELADLGFTALDWRILKTDLYPAAKTEESILRVLRRCKAQSVSPFDRPFHIVPMWNKDTRKLEDTIWPSIEYQRLKAHRSGVYAGMDPAVLGPVVTKTYKIKFKDDDDKWVERPIEISFYEWASVTVYRKIGSDRVPFATPPVFWEECVATDRRGVPNSMWQERPRGQHLKCVEAAALRMAFPEFASELTADEMAGRTIASTVVDEPAATPKPTAPPRSRLDAVKEATGVSGPAAPVAEKPPADTEVRNATQKKPDAIEPFNLRIDIGDGAVHTEKHGSAAEYCRAYWKQASEISDRVESTASIVADLRKLIAANAAELSRAKQHAPKAAAMLHNNFEREWADLMPGEPVPSLTAAEVS